MHREHLGKVQKNKEKYSIQLFWCLFFIYTSNIIGRTSFSAVTVALIDEAILTKTQAGLISGAFWLVYAVGQIAGGFLANKISPYILIGITVIGTAMSNVLMAGAHTYLPMLVVWSIGSVAQFGIWPSVLKLLSTEIIHKHRMMAMERLAFCYCIGSIFSYVFTALILLFSSWEYIFIGCGLINCVSFMVLLYAGRRVSPHLHKELVRKREKDTKEKLTWDIVWSSGFIFFCVLMLIKGIADQGIKSWMPTMLMETFGASPSYTSFLSVFLLFTNIFGVLICTYIYNKVGSDERKTLLLLYLMMMPMMVLLLDMKNMSIFIVTMLMSAVTILIYGSGQILQMNYPARFNRFGLTATVGGIINSFGAIGCVVATYGSGYVADNYGWNAMVSIWNVLIIVFAAITIIIAPLWKKFRKKY